MKKLIQFFSLMIIFSIIFLSCSNVPISGRRQLNIVPDSTLLPMSFNNYEEFLKVNKLSNDRRDTEMVLEIGIKLQIAVEQYFEDQGFADELEGFEWEFNLIESEDINAFCMPGGKVAVYTGILPICEGELGLAVVMSHEIAHAVAKHGNERMSQGLIAQMGSMALSSAISNKPEKTQQLWMNVFGVGAQVGVMLPYSRIHESEADYLGLIFMAIAGYDPHQAIAFWQRMSEANENQKPPEFLSTHPAAEKRINDIRAAIPEVMLYLDRNN